MGQHHRQVIPSTGARGRMNEFGATLCLLDLLLAPFLPRSKVEPRKVHVYPQTVTPKSGSYRVGRWWPRHKWLLATPTTPQKDATSGRATTTGAAMRLLGLALGFFFVFTMQDEGMVHFSVLNPQNGLDCIPTKRYKRRGQKLR